MTLHRLIMKLAVVCLACSASGCGTLLNTHDLVIYGVDNYPDNQIYGGLRWDATKVSEYLTSEPAEANTDENAWQKSERERRNSSSATTILCLIDMPFSIAADTLTLPLVIYRQVSAPREDERGRRNRSETDKKVDEKDQQVQAPK